MLNRIPGPARRFFLQETQETARNPGRSNVLEFPDRPRAPGRFRQVAASSGTPDTSGAIVFSGVISPAQLTADTNDWSPSGLASASIIRMSVNARDVILTGLAGGSDGRIIILRNVGTIGFALTDQDTASTAANRFEFNGNAVALMPNETVTLRYDHTDQRWNLLAQSDNGVHRSVSSGDVSTTSNVSFSTICGTEMPRIESTYPAWLFSFMAVYNSAATTTGAGISVLGAGHVSGVATLTATTAFSYFGVGISASTSTASLTTGNIAIGEAYIASAASGFSLGIVSEVSGSQVTALANLCFLECVSKH